MVSDQTLRREAIAEALKLYREDGDTTRETVIWREEARNLEVVNLRITALLLNHDNARLAGQLKSHPEYGMVLSDPTSPEAQDILSSLLAQTAQFKALKEQLADFGQHQPGLVTRDGLLVNGNTRLVALRHLGMETMRVAVLPEGTNSEDLLELEMEAQMKKWVHQEYTFTNELLFMKRYLSMGRTYEQLATQMGKKRSKKKIEARLRLLGIIEEVRERSSPVLPYSQFDDKEQILKDLDEKYQALKTLGDIQEAEDMKWSRLLAMFLGVNKDQVRTIEYAFFDEEIIERLESTSPARALLSSAVVVSQDDDLDELIGTDEKYEVVDARLILEKLLCDSSSRNPNGDVASDLEEVWAELAQTVRSASDQIIAKQRAKSFRTELSVQLREASRQLKSIEAEFLDRLASDEIDLGKFRYELNQLLKVTAELSAVVKAKID